jgi:hypothetical protein
MPPRGDHEAPDVALAEQQVMMLDQPRTGARHELGLVEDGATSRRGSVRGGGGGRDAPHRVCSARRFSWWRSGVLTFAECSSTAPDHLGDFDYSDV